MQNKNSNLDGLKVLLAVTGGVAACKAVQLAGRLARAGAAVRTVMTDAACRLVGPKSFEAVTGMGVYTDMWQMGPPDSIGHVKLADWAEVVVVAPATADVIAKIANGICDDLASTVVCACWGTSVILAPAMNDRMWKNPAVQSNVKRLVEAGYTVVGPEKGPLACGREGVGRMSEPEKIIEQILLAAGGQS
jgi:phosphopantothenoylcysteine decarboxylase/phosphopantothenate--cysteine ligase